MAFVVLLAVAAAILLPIVYAVLGGFKDERPAGREPGVAHPGPVGLRQLRRRPLGRERPAFWGELFNSVLVAIVAVGVTVGCASAAAFVFARIRFRGREAMYTLFVFGLLFPTAVAILPLYILIRQVGLSGSLLGVALPQAAFGLPLSIVILRPFFRSIPIELEDAARMDGCGSFGFFWRVLLPLSRPALATVSVLAIVTTWNAFILPLVVLNSADQWTLPLGVMNFAIDLQLGRGSDARLHRRLAHPRADLLHDRRAPHRGRPHGRIGEGLMATIETSYRDPALSVEARVADLLARMTRAEKVAQLGSFWAFEVVPESGFDEARLAALAADGIGHITRLAGSTNLRPIEVAETANAIQRYLVEKTRLGIPTIIHEECLHGLIAWAAPCFQQSIGAAASFDPDVVSATAATIRRRMLLTGARHALAPVLDIGRDPRWGRIEETYGEDPYLAAVLGCAYVEALQGSDLTEGVAATAKHMVGHGLAEGGMNQAPAHIGERELRDEQLFPFEAAVRRSRIASVMPAYCDVDGVPCHASTALLTGILREEWGFDGIVASDYIGVEMISTAHKLTSDLAEAARLALVAGVDAELPRTVVFGSPLETALADGRISDAALDANVARVLRLKFRLGLFDQPYVPLHDEAVFEALAADEALRRPRPRRPLDGAGQERRDPAARDRIAGAWR